MKRAMMLVEPANRQEVYYALNLLHTWALETLSDDQSAPVIEALDRAMDHILTTCEEVNQT